MTAPIDGQSILDNGQLTSTYTYYVRIDGNRSDTKVYEVISIDIQNGDYGKTLEMKIKKDDGTFEHVSPSSRLGQVISEDSTGARQNAFLNHMDLLSVKAGQQSVTNERTHENALKESGMYEISRGFEPLSNEIVDNTYLNVDPTIFNLEEALEGDNNSTDQWGRDYDDEAFGIPPENFIDGSEKKITIPKPSLKFPANAAYHSTVGLSQDYMKIDMFKYQAPQAAMLGEAFKPKDLNAKVEAKGPSLADTFSSGLKSGRRTKEYLGNVKLPIPNQLGSSNGVAWGEGSANAFEAAAFMAGYNTLGEVFTNNKGLNFLGLAGKLGTEASGQIRSILNANKGDMTQLITAQATKMALNQLNINTDSRQFVTRSTGKAVNPNLETLFSSPKIRSFAFGFEFLPQNAQDAQAIRRIMKFFKKGMLPARGSSAGGDSTDLFLLSPNVFRLSYMNGVNRIRSLNTFKMCALTGCEINFTPGNTWSAYDDPSAISQPTSSTMTLSFSELTPIFADDYDLTMKNRERLRDQIEEQGPLKEWFNEEDIGF